MTCKGRCKIWLELTPELSTQWMIFSETALSMHSWVLQTASTHHLERLNVAYLSIVDSSPYSSNRPFWLPGQHSMFEHLRFSLASRSRRTRQNWPMAPLWRQWPSLLMALKNFYRRSATSWIEACCAASISNRKSSLFLCHALKGSFFALLSGSGYENTIAAIPVIFH